MKLTSKLKQSAEVEAEDVDGEAREGVACQ